MKRKLRFLAGACLFTATALFSGCSSDDDFLSSTYKCNFLGADNKQ